MSASSPYTSVPPLTGSPFSLAVRTPDDTASVGADSVVSVGSVVSGAASVVVDPLVPVVAVVSDSAVVSVDSTSPDPVVVVGAVASSSSPHAVTTTSVVTASAASRRVLRFFACNVFPPCSRRASHHPRIGVG